MFQKLKDLLQRILKYFTETETTSDSPKMDKRIDVWEAVYTNHAPWKNDKTKSLNVAKLACQLLASQVLNEAEIKIEGPDGKENERSKFLNEQFQKHVMPDFKNQIEKAMAVGGMLIRPYVTEEKEIHIEFCRQGSFKPMGFDDDGNIVDVIFIDQLYKGETTYTRAERERLLGNDVEVENKAFVARGKGIDKQVPLSDVEEWASIDDAGTLKNAGQMLFGAYKVPLANNVDLESPLGISIFEPALETLQTADEQYSRLDWEYEGGQMAVDVAEDAIQEVMDQKKDRLYRRHDFNDEETYMVFAPHLRDANYINGLNFYLMRAEDQIGLARGTLADVSAEARTATEIKVLKQRAYTTIHDHQKAIEDALRQLVKAMDFLTSVYKIQEEQDVELVANWNDSVLEDFQSELTQHLQLRDAGIESSTEVRMWAKGESEEIASAKIQEIEESEQEALGEDIFSANNLLGNSPFNS